MGYKQDKTKEMNAREMFENSGVSRINTTHLNNGKGWYINEIEVFKLMEAYHTDRSKKEAEERYKKALDSIKLGLSLKVGEALLIASGKEQSK